MPGEGVKVAGAPGEGAHAVEAADEAARGAVRQDARERDAFERTVDALVDRSRVVEVERIDADALASRRGYRAAKRAFDVVASLCALVVCAIPVAVIAAAIKLDSPGPVLYRQERLGLGGKPFMITKFRSMTVDAERRGAQWTQDGDARVTKVGRVLRDTHLDEIPQFWAVVRGDLSLVGPRPERAVFYEEFEKYIPGFSQRLLVKPGLSGLAQVLGGYNLKPAEKIVYDIEYIKTQSLVLDAKIIWKTFGVLLTGKGAR